MSDKSNIKNHVKKDNIMKQSDVGVIVDKKIDFFKLNPLNKQKSNNIDIVNISL